MGFKGIKSGGKGQTEIVNLKLCPDGALSVREKRGRIRAFSDVGGIYADDTLAYVDCQRLYYGGMEISGITLSPGEKKILKIGRFLLVFPDKVYVDLEDQSKCGQMSLTLSIPNLRMYPVNKNKTEIKINEVSEFPEDPVNSTYYAIKQSDGSVVIKRFLNNAWQVCTPLVKMDSSKLINMVNVGDTVSIDTLQNYIGEYAKVLSVDGGSIIVEGYINESRMFYTSTLTRYVPDFDFVTVSGNRLCGVRRGVDQSGRMVSKIYASAVGEPFNFIVGRGGCEADVDVSGAFTGVCDYLGSPLAFSESELIETRIKNGSMIYTKVKGYGVERGAHESVASANGTVYYKTKSGICVYDGSYPEKILELSGSPLMTDMPAPAVYLNGKYRIKITDPSGSSRIYVYDEESDSFVTEDDPGVLWFACRGQCIYAACEAGGEQSLMMLNYESANALDREYCSDKGFPIMESDIAWRLVGERVGQDSFGAVHPIRAVLRLEKPSGARVSIGVIYNAENRAEGVVSIDKESFGAVTVPISLRKCDHFRLSVEGLGECSILGYAVQLCEGGLQNGWR